MVLVKSDCCSYLINSLRNFNFLVTCFCELWNLLFLFKYISFMKQQETFSVLFLGQTISLSLPLPIPPSLSLPLPLSPSLSLPLSPYISLFLPLSPYTSLSLPLQKSNLCPSKSMPLVGSSFSRGALGAQPSSCDPTPLPRRTSRSCNPTSQ